MTTAVVMCTYNGEKYILEQMESIFAQTRKPDEVIILDDCSTDSTAQIIGHFIVERGISDTWKLIINEKNLGWKKNFMTAMQRSASDLIFPSDQDDIWDRDKIRIMASICEKAPAIELLVCRHEPVDADTDEPVYWYQPSFGDEEVTKVPFDGAFAECRRQGCTYALRRDILRFVDGIWHEDWPHDQFFWCLAIARGTLYSYNRPLIRFRRHADNNSPSNEKRREVRAGLARKAADIAGELIANQNELGLSAEVVRTLHRAQDVHLKREKYLTGRNLFGIMTLLTRLDCYTRFKAWAGDLMVVLRKATF